MDLKQANEANKSGFWRVPNSFMKRIRQMSTNELRAKIFELAGALMDQRNANTILLQQIQELKQNKQTKQNEVLSEETSK